MIKKRNKLVLVLIQAIKKRARAPPRAPRRDIRREFKDVVFEDVVFDNNKFNLILYLDLT